MEILHLHMLRSYLHSFPYRTQLKLTMSLAYNILAWTTESIAVLLLHLTVALLRIGGLATSFLAWLSGVSSLFFVIWQYNEQDPLHCPIQPLLAPD
jgi:hypothetical protein